MAKDREIVLRIKMDGKGEIKATAQSIDKLNASAEQVNNNAGTLNRNLKGVAQNSKNATSGFAKQAQGMGGLVHIYATVAANVWALTAAFQVLKNASDLRIMAEAAQDLSISTGLNFAKVAKSMQGITGGAISFTEAMRQANLALSGGATVSQIEDITKVANKAANALGVSVPAAVGRMIQAVTKGEPELVDELGIILRVTRATEKYAHHLKKSVTALTTFERQQAIINQLLEQGEQKFGDAEVRTNPYEKLIASTSDIAKTSIIGISSVLEPIVTTMASNIGLVVAGFGLVASQIIKLVLPTLISTREELAAIASAELATQEQSNAAIAKSRQELKLLAEEKSRAIAVNDKWAGVSELASEDEGLLLQQLDKRSNIGKKVTSIINDGIKNNLSNVEIGKTLKESGLMEKLNKELSSQAKRLPSFKKDTTGPVRDALREQLTSVSDLVKAEKDLIQIQKDEAILIDRQRIQAKQALVTSNKALLAQGRSQITSATSIRAAYSTLNTTITSLNMNNIKLAQSTTLVGGAMLSVQNMAAKTTLRFAFLGRVMSGLSGPVFAAVTTILFAVEGVKSFLNWTGVLNEELDKQAAALAATTKETALAAENYAKIGEEISELPVSLEELTDKWTKVKNVTDQYTGSITDAIKNTKELSAAKWWDYLFSPDEVGNAAENAAETILTSLRELEKTTGTKIEVEVEVEDAKEMIRELTTSLPSMEQYIEVSERTGMGDKEVLAQYKEDIVNMRLAIKDLEDGTLTVTKDTLPRFLEGIVSSKKEWDSLEKSWKKVGKSVTAETTKVVTSVTEFKDAIFNIDRKLFELSQKSESRRILNVDTLIGFRDELARVRDGMTELFNSKGFSEQKRKDIFENLSEIPENFNKALVGLDLKGKDKELDDAWGTLNNALEKLDVNIDVIRNYKSEVAILGQEEKRLRNIRDRGGRGTTLKLYEAETDKLALQVGHLRSKIAIQKTLVSALPEEAKTNNIILEAMEKELEVTKDILSARNSNIALIEEEKEALVKIQGIEKARSRLISAEEKFNKDKLNAIKDIISPTAKTLDLLEGQLTLLNRSTKKTQKLLKLESDILEVTIKRIRASKDLSDDTLPEEIQLLEKLVAMENAKLAALLKEKSIRLEIIKAEQEAFGIQNSLIKNSFVGVEKEGFGAALKHELFVMGEELGKKIANPIKQYATLFVASITSVTSTLVDSLLNKDWEGKDEGDSRWTAIRKAFGATMRESVGSAIKNNMNQAIMAMVGEEDKKLATINSQIMSQANNTTALGLLNLSVQQLTMAMRLQATSSSMPGGDILSMFNASPTPGNPTPFASSPGAGTPMATGGIVHRPTNALIGEGANSEAVVPLPDNKSIPVKLEGSTENISINQSFDFRGADSATEGRLRAFAQQIKKETIKELTDNINRGGSMAKVVGRR